MKDVSRFFTRVVTQFILLAVTSALLWHAATPAKAHFLLNLNVRIFHVEHLSDGVRVYLRLPMPYLVADRVGPVGVNGLPEPAPYTSNLMEEEKLVHYVDAEQFQGNPDGLGKLAAEGHRLLVDDNKLEAIVEQVRIHRVGAQPAYATLDEARKALLQEKSIRMIKDPSMLAMPLST
jgi:hypothetical protein